MKITRDGREICETTEEMKVRRFEVWKRDGGRCQCTKDCGHHFGRKCLQSVAPTVKIACETNCSVAHIHHRVKRSVLRDDRIENLETQCWPCHAEEK